jgi:hypothetical protein
LANRKAKTPNQTKKKVGAADNANDSAAAMGSPSAVAVATAATGSSGGHGAGAAGMADVDYATHTCQVVVRLPLRAPKLLMLEVVERCAAATMVRETPGIDKVRMRVCVDARVVASVRDGLHNP